MAEKLKGNLVVAQSGGPTAVINASVAGVAEEAFKHADTIPGVIGSLHGIEGVLYEDLIDLAQEDRATISGLTSTPAAALGSCRHKLTEADYDRIIEVFRAHDIRYFFYTGGNDSMDTAARVSRMGAEKGYEVRSVGIPKTIDNDLAFTDHCPGFGSVARWVASSVRDAGLDTEAIGVVDKIKIVEIMGRNAGWITAASALARDHEDAAPHLIYVPEKPINLDRFLGDVQNVYDRLGYCLITVCEGVKGEDGKPLMASTSAINVDAFGHAQMGGVADYLCSVIADRLKLKARFDKPGTIQRVSAALQSPVDRDEAYGAGAEAVRQAIAGVTGKMVTIERVSDDPYRSKFGLADLDKVANAEKLIPEEFLSPAGNDVTEAFVKYAQPLIGGPLPKYSYLKKVALPKKVS
ncbi:MAG: 6-phosphofructokinase [Anaerolineae bacterium]|nr:6-phosphofructokinase [Anaerolineae bacterium]